MLLEFFKFLLTEQNEEKKDMSKRQIEPAMVKFIDAKLASNGLAQKAIEDKDARLLFSLAAQACVGIREQGGNNRGPMVVLIQETVGGASREAWCMAFVQTMIAYVETRLGVVSPIAVGEHCMSVWRQTPKSQRVKTTPAKGAICIWNYPPGQNGHTGVVLEYGTKEMQLIEGNTESGLTSKGTIERDGGGVYHTKRSTKSSKKMVIVGFLKPF